MQQQLSDDQTLALWAYAKAMDGVGMRAYQGWLDQKAAMEPSSYPMNPRGNPLLSLILVGHGDQAAFRTTLDSFGTCWRSSAELIIAVSCQTVDRFATCSECRFYDAGRVVMIDKSEAAAENAALLEARGEFVAFVSEGDTMTPGALTYLAELLQQRSKIDVLYTDEDWSGEEGRHSPRFKSSWDPEGHLGFDLFGRLCLMRLDLVRAVGGLKASMEPAHHYDLHLRVAAASRSSKIYHLPCVCYSRRAPRPSPTDQEEAAALARYAEAAGRAASQAASASFGRQISVKPSNVSAFVNRVFWPLPDAAPLVSVIVPTRNRADLLATCSKGVLAGTDYPNLEFIVIDNGSTEYETLHLLEELRSDTRVRIVRDPGPFNFSRLINNGARQARGSILALVNNDIEVVMPGWLSELVSLASRSEIGCVGAKLLYAQQDIQHTGIVLQEGPLAMHAFRRRSKDNLGYDAQPAGTRAYLAVTAACMVVRRDLFEIVGGFDEGFEVAFNDVDFCLKIADVGYLNVCSPYQHLLHHEGMSRGSDESAEHRGRFARELALLNARWTDRIAADPFGNPNIHWDWNAGIRLSDQPRLYPLR